MWAALLRGKMHGTVELACHGLPPFRQGCTPKFIWSVSTTKLDRTVAHACCGDGFVWKGCIAVFILGMTPTLWMALQRRLSCALASVRQGCTTVCCHWCMSGAWHSSTATQNVMLWGFNLAGRAAMSVCCHYCMTQSHDGRGLVMVLPLDRQS